MLKSLPTLADDIALLRGLILSPLKIELFQKIMQRTAVRR